MSCALLHSLVTFAIATACCSAQVTATYAPFGAGCPGTGTGLGATEIMPAVARTTWGAGNGIPFGWSPNRYQQAFLGTELPTARTIGAMSLRQPHTGVAAHNFTVDMEIRVGYTTRWLPTMSMTFASNWDVGPPVVVLPRSYVDFPDQATPPPQIPTQMLITIPWPTTFQWVPQPGRNLLVEVVVYGNSFGGGIYGYPLDNTSGTVSLCGTPATATVGDPLIGMRSFGPVMGFVEQTNAAVPRLYSTDTPQIGNTFRVRLSQTAPSSVALLMLGWNATSWSGLPLPLDLGFLGAPGCSLLVDGVDFQVLLTSSTGAANLQYTLPNVIYVLGSSFYNQALVLDATVNALGFVTTNGGHGVFGNQ